jgi:hypothetical protein
VPKINKRDFAHIAEYIINEWSDRKRRRRPLERQWKEIDRQLRMEPDKSHKLDSTGKEDKMRAWMPEVELPLQSQTLEVLTADSQRMRFPSIGTWFTAHSALTDKYLDRVDFQALIAGDENDVPSLINQDNADNLVIGTLNHFHNQYDFRGNVDLIDSEAFKYGVGVGKARTVQKTVFMNSAKGMVKQSQRIPVLFPRSIKNTYLDQSQHNLMNEGHVIGPLVIEDKIVKVEDLRQSAKGNTDPNREDGGWMPGMIKNLEGDKNGNINLIEAEGDIVCPRKSTGNLFFPNVIITVAQGKVGEKEENRVIRVRFRQYEMDSHIEFHYHRENVDSSYGTSPLMKGWPIQKAASEALMRSIMAAQLNTQPPMGYDGEDSNFIAQGGPRIYPGAQWPTIGDVRPYMLGDPSAMFAMYQGLLQQYYDVTGVNTPRLGAQTVSHTTAFAKDAELTRGTIRTVDYIQSTNHNAMVKWLNMAFRMGRDHLKETQIYIDAYKGFVKVNKNSLPDDVVFEVFGSGGPSEEVSKNQKRLNSMQLALSLDQIKAQYSQLGYQSSIDIESAIEQVLSQGGWNDLDVILGNSAAPGASIEAGIPGDTGGFATAPATALQAIGGGTGG